MKLGIAELYCGSSGKQGFYNSQELGLARAMKKLGHDCVVFYPDPTAARRREQRSKDGIMTVYLPAKAIGVHGWYNWDLLKDYDIQAVQLGSDNQLAAPDFSAWCHRQGIPIYHYVGVAGSSGASGLKKTAMDLAYRRNLAMLKTDKCFVKTSSVAGQLAALGVPQPEIAPVGLDLSIIPEIGDNKLEERRGLGLPLNRKILLYVGRIDPYKRPMDALELLAMLPASHILVMIGTGSLDDRLNEEIRRRGLTERVRRIAKLPNRQVQKYYAACDWYVNFNHEEIFGMSILEAMYQGCTVMAYPAPGPKDIIEDGRSGFLAEDLQTMAQLIAQGWHVKPEAARWRILRSFTWDSTAQKFDRWLRAQQTR